MYVKQILLLSGLLFLAGFSEASILTYPGPAPCDTTLQSCIEAADSGDTIYIAQAVVNESLFINKSLTLMPAPGHPAPVIGGSDNQRLLQILAALPGTHTIDVRLNQLHLVNASIDVTLSSGSGHKVKITNSTIEIDQEYTNGIQLTTSVPSDITISKNMIVSGSFGIHAYNPLDVVPSFLTKLTIVGNKITTSYPSRSRSGIYVNSHQTSQLLALIHSNAIYSVGGSPSGSSEAITVGMADTAYASIWVVNNTIDDIPGNGIYVGNIPAGASLTLRVYNNVVSNIDNYWIGLPAQSNNVSIQHDYNTYYNAGGYYGGYPAGPNTTFANPSYTNAAQHNYVPGPFSSLAEAGLEAELMPNANYDADGGPRRLGPSIDRGAFERRSTLLGSLLNFYDSFEDFVEDQDYIYEKGDWVEDGKSLVSTTDGKEVVLMGAGQFECDVCTVEADIRTAGASLDSPNKLWLLGWYENKGSRVELLIRQDTGKILLKQFVNGSLVKKAKANVTLQPQTDYRFQIKFDGTDFVVKIDGVTYITMAASGSPFGTAGFQKKGSPGYLGGLYAY